MRFLIRRLKYLLTNGFPTEPYKMVIVVRTDIPMGKGKIAAQCAHAAVECFSQCLNSQSASKKYLDAWLNLGQPKIVLKVLNEESLKQLAKEAKNEGLITSLIRDAGRTQVEYGTITVLGIGPGPNTIVNKVTSQLQLL